MTNAGESTIETAGSLPMPIAEMCPGFFWASRRSIFPNGDPISDLEIQVRVEFAYNSLVAAPTASPGVS